MPPTHTRHPHSDMSLLLPFDDQRATRVDLCGGKGANLALLTQHGFPVPPGWWSPPSRTRSLYQDWGRCLPRPRISLPGIRFASSRVVRA